MLKIGIYGGSFNPVHWGHQVFAEKFISQFDLDILHIIPTYISPFKQNENLSTEMNFHRLIMLNIAFKKNTKIIIDEFEVNKKDISYTINTVEHLKSIYNESSLYMLIGEDNAINFDKWKNWEGISKLVTPVIVIRKYKDKILRLEQLHDLYYFKDSNLQLLDAEILEISSTQIKENIENNVSNFGLMNPEVLEYIEQEKLYIS